MKVWVYHVDGGYGTIAEVRKIFDTRDKAEKWHRRMLELTKMHEQYRRFGMFVNKDGVDTKLNEINALKIEAGCLDLGNDMYDGVIMEVNVE